MAFQQKKDQVLYQIGVTYEDMSKNCFLKAKNPQTMFILKFWFFFQNVYAPDDDPEMEIEIYDRTFDQNEELGLNDMKTENYESSWQEQSLWLNCSKYN